MEQDTQRQIQAVKAREIAGLWRDAGLLIEDLEDEVAEAVKSVLWDGRDGCRYVIDAGYFETGTRAGNEWAETLARLAYDVQVARAIRYVKVVKDLRDDSGDDPDLFVPAGSVVEVDSFEGNHLIFDWPLQDKVIGATWENGEIQLFPVDSTGRQYEVVNGTYFHLDTPHDVANILTRSTWAKYGGGKRIRLYFGDTDTGRDWQEVYDVAGYIGRSTGRIKIPLLLNNKRSTGGPGILTHCIVKIRYANKADGGVLYEHPNYHRCGDNRVRVEGNHPKYPGAYVETCGKCGRELARCGLLESEVK